MADVLTKEQKSHNMSTIKGRNTKPEISLRKLLFKKGMICYITHYKLKGKPNIVSPSNKIAVFIDGCFWHKCTKCFTPPETRKIFWKNKINGNVNRDKKINRLLK